MNNNIIIELTEGQTAAIAKLVQVQARGEKKSADGMAASLFDIALRGRAIAAAKTAKENDALAYDTAIANGFSIPETKGEYINRRQIEWATVLGSLGLELRAGEWKRVKGEDASEE